MRRLSLRVGGALIALLVSRPLSAQTRTADSALATALLHESTAAAIAVPRGDSLRVGLLLTLARAHIANGDIAAATRLTPFLGDWKRRVHTDAACWLLERARYDDAREFVRRLPVADRDWALAHLASQLIPRPVWSSRPELMDTVALVRRAMAIVGEITAPAARTDALISIAGGVLDLRDTVTAARALDSAVAQVRRVGDADFASSRRLLIAREMGRTGQTQRALALTRSLPAPDRLELPVYATAWRDTRDLEVRAEIDRVTPLLDTVRDRRARAYSASRVVYALNSLGAVSAASALNVRTAYLDLSTDRPWRPVAAGAAIDTMDDPRHTGRRALAYLELATSLEHARPDTIAILLQRARRTALATRLSPAVRDDVLWQIGSEQAERGFWNDAAATINAIADPGMTRLVLIARSSAAAQSFRARRRFVARLANADVRAWGMAGVVEQALAGRPNAAAVRYATALADSIPVGPARERAFVSIANRSFASGDTAGARIRLLSVLPAHRTVPRGGNDDWRHDTLISALVVAGAATETVAWARARSDPAERATALFDASVAIRARGKIGGGATFGSNRGDRCRDGF